MHHEPRSSVTSKDQPYPSETTPSKQPVTLPDEKVRRIFGYCSRSTLPVLLRVCQNWYEILGPILYRTLEYDFDRFPFFEITPPPAVKKSKNPFRASWLSTFRSRSQPKILGSARRPTVFEGLSSEELSPLVFNPHPSPNLEPTSNRPTKIDLLKSCTILRIPFHDKTYSDACAKHLNHLLNPTTVVLRRWFEGTSRRCLHHLMDPTSLSRFPPAHSCACLEGISPTKLIIQACICHNNWIFGHRITVSTIQKIVFIHLPSTLRARSIIACKPPVSCSKGYAFWDIKNFTMIFSKVDNDDSQDFFSQEDLRTFADQIEYRHGIGQPQENSTTFVNSESLVKYRDAHNPIWDEDDFGPLDNFEKGLKERWFGESYWFLSVEQREEMWNRVQFVTKEKYMARPAREIEGELEELGW